MVKLAKKVLGVGAAFILILLILGPAGSTFVGFAMGLGITINLRNSRRREDDDSWIKMILLMGEIKSKMYDHKKKNTT
jgi:hypothetical protein